jgi:PAS domain S-box-containing protein
MISVLYVDDEPGLLEVGKLFLEQSGQFSVDIITSAPAALALLQEKTYDAIISDYQMPVMDGIGFLKKVRSSGNTIPFILFTGRGREEVVIQALNEGADFYLQKGGEPVAQFTELAHQVRQAVQQRKAEISIRDLERREADIINFLPDATFAIDRSGNIIAWNRSIEEMTGIPAAEMLGKGDYEYAIPFYGQRQPILIDLIYESDEVIARKYSHIVHKKDILIADTALPRPKGKPLTLMGKASPLYNQQGEIIGAIESIRDISEMKKAEESLRESEGQFAAFMDHLPVTAFIKDDQSTNLFVNRRMVELFGEQEWIGKSVYEQFPKDAAEKMIEDDRQTVREGYRKSIEYLAQKNGDKRIFETHKFRIDRDNKPPLIGGFAIDITEQKRAEDAIRESEEKYRSTIDAFPDAVSVIDKEFDVILANTNLMAWMRSLGFNDDIVGKPFLEAFPFLSPAVLDEYRTVYSKGTMMISEESSKIGNRVIITETRKIPFREHGEIVAVVAIIRDVTERKRAEEALNESEMRFRKIFENSPLGMALVTPDFRFYSVNPAWVAMTGYTEGELLNMSFTDITHPEHLAGDLEHIRELAEGKIQVYSAEKRYIRKDKSILWGLIKVTAIRDQQGALRYFAAQIEDITERRRAEDELRKSEERYRNIVEDQTEFISRFLPDGTHIFVNEAYCRYFGLKREELLGHRFRPNIPAEDRERVSKFFASLTPDNPVDSIEHRIILPDGSIRWQRWSDRAIFDPSRRITEYQSVGQDITGKKETEIALRESEDQFRRLISQSFDAVVVHRKGRIVLANDSAARILGTGTAADLVGRSLISLVHPEFRATVTARVRQMLQSPEETVPLMEEKFVRDDGTTVDVEVMATAAQHDGAPAVMVVFRDITGRKNAEEILRKSEAHLKRAEEVGRSGSWEFRLSENMVIASEGARVLYGLKGTHWTIAEVQKIPLPEYRPLLDTAIRDLIAGKSPYNLEFRIFRQTDGAVLDIHSLAEYDPEHNVVFGVIQDITGRRKAEEELTFKNLILSTQQETSLDGILIVDEKGRILNYNRKFTEIWGIPEHLIASRIDEPVLLFVVGQNADPEAFLSRVRYLYDHKEETSFEELNLKDGRILERFSAPIISDRGKYYGRVWYFRDITGRRKADKTVKEVNKKLNILSKITRHDINNQLTLLQGYLKILEKKLPDPSFSAHFNKAITAAQNISSMIRFTREYEEIGVNAPVWQDCRALADAAAAQITPGDIRVKNDLPAGTEIFADPLIVKVFYNIMDNSVRYGRKITTIRVSVQESGDDHLIVCEDDGDGVPADEKERIFERNFGRNTGLGLFLSREILGITGITIRETGVPGEGARFEIIVPKEAYRITRTGRG